jgi:hypothetical protein
MPEHAALSHEVRVDCAPQWATGLPRMESRPWRATLSRVTRTTAALLALLVALPALAMRAGLEAGTGVAHELAGVDLTLRWTHVQIFVPFGALGFANVFVDGAPTVAGGLRFYSGDGEGLVMSLQGAAVWTPQKSSVEDAGFRGAAAVTLGGAKRWGDFFVLLAAGPVAGYANGFALKSLPHGRNWFHSWPVDLDVAAGFEF